VDSYGHNAEAEAEAEAEAIKKEQKQKQASPSAPSCEKERLQETLEQRATQGENENSPSRREQKGVESFDSVAAASKTQIPAGMTSKRPGRGDGPNTHYRVVSIFLRT